MMAEAHADGEPAGWQDEVFDLLRQHRVTQFAYVPDAGHKILINRSLADPAVHSVALTTEEEGVALPTERSSAPAVWIGLRPR